MNLMPKYNMRKGRPLSRLKRPNGPSPNVPPRALQPSPVLKSDNGQVKVRIMPAGFTVTHPVISIQDSSKDQNTSSNFNPQQQSQAQQPHQPRNLELDNNNSNDSIAAALSFFETCQRPADQIFDSVLETSNHSVLQTPPRMPRPTPPSSPSRSSRDGPSWIPDLSMNNEDSVQSTGSEVDRQLLSMMSENSIDFTSKFAKLASAVVGHNSSDD